MGEPKSLLSGVWTTNFCCAKSLEQTRKSSSQESSSSPTLVLMPLSGQGDSSLSGQLLLQQSTNHRDKLWRKWEFGSEDKSSLMVSCMLLAPGQAILMLWALLSWSSLSMAGCRQLILSTEKSSLTELSPKTSQRKHKEIIFHKKLFLLFIYYPYHLTVNQLVFDDFPVDKFSFPGMFTFSSGLSHFWVSLIYK